MTVAVVFKMYQNNWSSNMMYFFMDLYHGQGGKHAVHVVSLRQVFTPVGRKYLMNWTAYIPSVKVLVVTRFHYCLLVV